MKTIKNLYKTLTFERIKEIIVLASKGKKGRKEVQIVLNDLDYYAHEIQKMLEDKTYYMAESRKKTINERGKVRELTVSPFYPNRILDYIVTETLKPYIRKSMYEYCIGNVNGRGMTYGKKAIARKYRHYKYYIKLDIRHFYPSVSSSLLVDMISKKVKDEDFMGLVRCVCLSSSDLPIGSYYSQWFSNWFLQELDHKIKEEWGIPFYVRYVDDMLLMGDNKRQLLRAMHAINGWLASKGLSLKRIEQTHEVKDRPIDFLGFRFCENRIILRTKNFHRLNVRLKKAKRHICASQARSLLSYIGWLKQTKSGYLYYKNRIEGFASIGILKRIVSKHGIDNASRALYNPY